MQKFFYSVSCISLLILIQNSTQGFKFFNEFSYEPKDYKVNTNFLNNTNLVYIMKENGEILQNPFIFDPEMWIMEINYKDPGLRIETCSINFIYTSKNDIWLINKPKEDKSKVLAQEDYLFFLKKGQNILYSHIFDRYELSEICKDKQMIPKTFGIKNILTSLERMKKLSNKDDSLDVSNFNLILHFFKHNLPVNNFDELEQYSKFSGSDLENNVLKIFESVKDQNIFEFDNKITILDNINMTIKEFSDWKKDYIKFCEKYNFIKGSIRLFLILRNKFYF